MPGPPPGPFQDVPLGRLCGARSGDKGGAANVGLWAVSPEVYAWLRGYLTVDRFKDLLTEAASLPVERYELPNLLALNFVVPGLLAPGVSGTTRPDAQAKGLGEYLRSRLVPAPAGLLQGKSPHIGPDPPPARPLRPPSPIPCTRKCASFPRRPQRHRPGDCVEDRDKWIPLPCLRGHR